MLFCSARVQDSYDNQHPFNASRMDAAVQPWFDAGCAVERMSFGLLTDQALNEKEVAAMLTAVRARGVKRVDLWSEPWTYGNLTTVWDTGLRKFIADDSDSEGGSKGQASVEGHRHAVLRRLNRRW